MKELTRRVPQKQELRVVSPYRQWEKLDSKEIVITF